MAGEAGLEDYGGLILILKDHHKKGDTVSLDYRTNFRPFYGAPARARNVVWKVF